MKQNLMQVLGVVLLVFGAQGAIRLVFDHDASGLLGWLPGGLVVWLIAYVALAGVGLIGVRWGHDRAKTGHP